ncbi:glutathione S-transferase family protein [Pararobbsia alpina]|uniref:Putative GST-like protein YibF n=1 Tax=Pararobbsia alpina TaxID=621374 RepID=A0A6S7BPN5_9BURK|nr:glutathione S-transferase [Pararobbsia alpina]CAB3795318.1 putative GST-like protein YibF [Pararobbsia alpina]
MKIHYSPTSPFVRKVLVAGAELGFEMERLPSAANPVTRDQTIVATNPLGQVPTLFTDDGMVLYDSRVICEYLDALAGGNRLFPAPGAARWERLTEQSLADGLLDAALLMRYERVMRPDEMFFKPWQRGQHEKVTSALARLESWAPGFGERVDIGTISIACALAYLDLRFPDEGWRRHTTLAAWYERFSARESMQRTEHQVPA